jgi:two-component system, NarL family, response regulator YdfI
VIRVLIAASSAIIRAGLESLVRSSPALELVGSEAGLVNLEPVVERERPDVVLADLEFPQEEAPSLELLASAPVVLLVSNPPGPWTVEALRSGVRAVLPRDVSASEMIAAIEAAAAGLTVFHSSDLHALLPAPPRAERATSLGSGEALTPRELEVFAMLSEGAGNKTIAWKLGISEHTVKFHVASIMSKLNATSRTEAVAIGIRKGLIML